jgi:hypothetical protein
MTGIPTEFKDGRDKPHKLISKHCKNCGIEIVTKIYVDATEEELSDIGNICTQCRLQALDPTRRIYVCGYCDNATFRMTAILNPNTGHSETEVRCLMCGWNEQKLVEKV